MYALHLGLNYRVIYTGKLQLHIFLLREDLRTGEISFTLRVQRLGYRDFSPFQQSH